MTVSLIHGNALTLPLADQSVALIVSSPPYFSLRSYRDGDDHYDGQLGSEESPHHFLAALWQVMDECWRVLRDDGSCWINLGDKFAGSGGHNNSGITRGYSERRCPSCDRVFTSGRNKCHICGVTTLITPTAYANDKATRRQAPDRYNQNSGGLRPKSRMLLPHLFAAGTQYPWLRHAVEMEAGRQRTHNPPQWICRMDVVWAKPNGLPESVTDRVRASHEYWFHLVKSERYYSALDTIREDYSDRVQDRQRYAGRDIEPSQPYAPGDRNDPLNARGILGFGHRGASPLGKLPGSVWEIPSEPLLLPDHLPQHFAAFPSEWPRRLVLGWSPSGVCVRCGEGRRPVCERELVVHHAPAPKPGTRAAQRDLARPDGDGLGWNGAGYLVGRTSVTITGTACACPTPDAPTRPSVVLDMFGGTGTTAIVASALGRHGISVDLSADYHRIARWRDQDGGLRAKALGVERPARQIDGQGALFDAAG